LIKMFTHMTSHNWHCHGVYHGGIRIHVGLNLIEECSRREYIPEIMKIALVLGDTCLHNTGMAAGQCIVYVISTPRNLVTV